MSVCVTVRLDHSSYQAVQFAELCYSETVSSLQQSDEAVRCLSVSAVCMHYDLTALIINLKIL